MTKEKLKKKLTIGSILKRIGIAILILIAAALLIIAIIRGIIWFSNHINTENGVDEGIYVTLGGQEQYLLIRGEDIRNPVIIWLHGGPSIPDTFVNYTFQKYMVDEYTIINWDQRGCGRTYFQNMESDAANQTASFEQAQVDLDELVEYACNRFNQEKVIIVGHSYGTMLGSQYVLNHPDKVLAYVGVAQVVSIADDRYSYETAYKLAETYGDDTSAMEAAYKEFEENKTLDNLSNLRGHISKYFTFGKEANVILLGLASPYMGIDDLRWFLKQLEDFEGYVELNRQLMDCIMEKDVRDFGLDYQVPVGFISGSCDWISSIEFSVEYYDMIKAPKKQFQVMNALGHSPQLDSPEEFAELLKDILDDSIE